jgi:hypothetical protein
MLTKEQFEHLANRLIEKTAARQVVWRVGQEFTSDEGYLGREFEIEFPSTILSVGYFVPASSPTSGVDYVLLTISDKQGIVVEQRRITLRSDDWERAVGLCTTAYEAVFGTNTLDEIFQLVDSDEKIGQPSKSKELFSLIKGTWHVTYTFKGKPGAEDAIIDGDGYYYLTTAPSLKYFKLMDAEFSPDNRNIRFTKVSASGASVGRPHDTETLTLSPDGSSMEGLSVGYGHTMKYTRISP